MIFALIKNEIVENLIEAEEDSLIALRAIFSDMDEIVEVNGESGVPIIGLGYKNGRFQQFASWNFSNKDSDWIAPVERPAGDSFIWSELEQEWIDTNLPLNPEETENS